MLKGFVSGEEKDIVRIPMKGKNLVDESKVTLDTYLSEADGKTGNSTVSDVTDYIDINASPLVISGVRTIDILNSTTRGACFYDSNKNYIRGFAYSPDVMSIPVIISNIPSNAKYVRFAFDKAFENGIMLNSGSEALPYEPYGYQEGWEVRDNQDRLIWGREDELQTTTGALPFKGYSLPLKVKSLLGNAVQNGTPSPDNIITPEMCGVLNESFAIIESDSYSLNDWYYEDTRLTDLLPPGTYTISFVTDSITAGTTTDGTIGIGTTSDYTEDLEWFTRAAVGSMTIVTVTLSESKCLWARFVRDHNIVRITCSISVSKIRVEEGSTAYGWKVPFENHGENLFDMTTVEDGKNVSLDGSITNYSKRCSTVTPIDVSAYSNVTLAFTATLSRTRVIYALFNDSTLVTRQTAIFSGTTIDVSSGNKLYICFYDTADTETVQKSDLSNVMFNTGSTAKPYSPYLNETLPVYLGEVPTVRRVKKLVLTSTTAEWTYDSTYSRFTFRIADSLVVGVRLTPVACSHFVSITDGRSIGDVPNNAIYSNSKETTNNWFIKTTDYTTASSFKQFLDDELAAGHPVTVWYVLNTEETTISNEPLCKISTYADELTTIQVHGLSAPLYGIGDYKDTLNLSTGVVTRKVKRLVLDGTENWNEGTSNYYIFINVSGRGNGIPNSTALSTHTESGVVVNNNGTALFFKKSVFVHSSLADLKSYLAAQYANGTPVTIWYVLAEPETETVTVPTGMTGEIEGYLTQVSTPTPTNRSVPKWNGVEETGGTYAVTVYTPPEIPTTTGQNTLTVDANLAPSKLEVSIHAKKIHYGFKIDKSNDDSESAVIYTHDAVTMTPAHMDFTNDRFDYGSWGNAFFVRDCYPVALNLDGTIAYRLDPDDYTKKTDGTASDIFYELLTAAPSDWSTQWKQYYTKSGDEYVLNDQSSAPTFATDTYYKLTYNSSFTGNFMMAFPKVWFYRHEDSQYNYIEISNLKLSDDWKCYAHINASGQEVDFIYLPLFKGVIKDSKLRSLPGQIPQGNTTATDEVNAATALGTRWQIWDHSSVELINDLLTLMSKSIDSQGRYGVGRSNAYNASDTVTYGKLQSGTLIKKGKFHGDSSGYKDVKVFGIESFWANRYDRIQGLLLANGVWKVKMTPPYNFTGTDFVTLSSASVPTDAGYLSRVQTSEYGSIPAATISTSGKYFKDFFYRYSNDTCVPLRGGNCGDTDIAGYRFIYAGDPASRTVWSFGASPVYK